MLKIPVEMGAACVTLCLKLFRRKEATLDLLSEKKMAENSTFGELFTKEIQEIMKNVIPNTTKSHSTSHYQLSFVLFDEKHVSLHMYNKGN